MNFATHTIDVFSIRELRVMKTFYPQKNIPYHLIILASLSALVLSGDERTIQDVDVPAEIYDHYFDIDSGLKNLFLD